jgi:hypothetical protein
MDLSLLLPKLYEIAKKIGGKLISSKSSEKTVNNYNTGGGSVYQFVMNDGSTIDARKVVREFDRPIEQMKSEGGYSFLTESHQQKRESILQNGICLSDQEFNFVQAIIPKQDRSLWLTASILRSDNSSNPTVVERIKYDLRQKAGERGNNIANLCSTDYLKDEIIPTYNSLPEEGREEAFADYYESLVTTLKGQYL